MSGTGLPTGRYLRAHLTDVTPTILALLGHSIPAHIEGIPIDGSSSSSTEPHPGFSTTRRDDPQEPLEGPHRKPFEYTFEEQALIEQRLADLGYLE